MWLLWKFEMKWLEITTKMWETAVLQEQQHQLTTAASEVKYVSHDTQHFRCLDVLYLHSEFLSKIAPDWPWRWVTLASFPRSLPLLQPYVVGLIFGMLLMSELEGIPSCWMLGTISLKTEHQKWDTWKWLTQFSPEFRHFN